jgi:hypothetical protein
VIKIGDAQGQAPVDETEVEYLARGEALYDPDGSSMDGDEYHGVDAYYDEQGRVVDAYGRPLEVAMDGDLLLPTDGEGAYRVPSGTSRPMTGHSGRTAGLHHEEHVVREDGTVVGSGGMTQAEVLAHIRAATEEVVGR